MSEVHRITLRGNTDLESVILKRPSKNQKKLRIATRFNSYNREKYFYANLSQHSAIRSPRCYFNAKDDFLLLLEDAGQWPVCDTNIGASLNQATSAIRHLARFHASYWDRAPTKVSPFAQGFEAAALDMPSLTQSLLKTLPQNKAMKFMLHYAKQSIKYLPLFVSQKQVFSHMDFRLDNIRIKDEELMVFDWGESSFAAPGCDLAYFIITSLTAKNRRLWEGTLLSTYHRTLGENGVQYDIHEVFNSYRLAIPPIFYLPALVFALGNQAFGITLSTRCLAAVSDHLIFIHEKFGQPAS